MDKRKHEIDVEVAGIAKAEGWNLPDARLIEFGLKVWNRASYLEGRKERAMSEIEGGDVMLEQVVALKIYEHLREAHKSIAAIRHEFNLTGIEDCAVDAVDSALYLAEHIVMARMQK